MTPSDRRDRDPTVLQLIRARLARIKVAQTTTERKHLAATMPPNWIEKAILPDPPKRKECCQ